VILCGVPIYVFLVEKKNKNKKKVKKLISTSVKRRNRETYIEDTLAVSCVVLSTC
jgi:hypothetical protein